MGKCTFSGGGPMPCQIQFMYCCECAFYDRTDERTYTSSTTANQLMDSEYRIPTPKIEYATYTRPVKHYFDVSEFDDWTKQEIQDLVKMLNGVLDKKYE